MRAIIQRVKSASVAISGADVAAIGPGVLVLVGIAPDDTPEDSAYVFFL
jgi:D-tyrosyl-tRNA(Tyr) deacylase